MRSGTIPDEEDIGDALHNANQLIPNVYKALEIAEDANAQAIEDENPARMDLNDFEYGEEEIRLRDLLPGLTSAQSTLEQARENPSSVTADQVNTAIKAVEFAQDEYDDVGIPIPPDDSELEDNE